MICLTLTENSIEKNLLTYQRNASLIDLVELRVDLLQSDESHDAIIRFPSMCDKPVILTCRRVSDGGKYTRGDRSRLQFMHKLLDGEFAYIDLEEDLARGELEDLIKKKGIRIIRSFHDMHKMPGNLFSKIKKIASFGEIPKAAVMLNSFNETARIFNGARELQDIKEKILIGMGPFGVPTRILYKKTGSMLTFCSAADSMQGAPGQLTPEILKKVYRADLVDNNTLVYGIIGNPIMHTASPRIHNPGYHKLGINAVYVPFHVENVRSFFQFADNFPIDGFSVTVPHKQNVLPYLGTITREVKQIGSCNTVVRTKGFWKGINTDYYGFLHPIQEDLETGTIKRALVLGAGGAARSVVWGLRNFGCLVTIHNRTHDRAIKLAAETGSSVMTTAEISTNEKIKFDLIVQTTSVGMEPHVLSDPLVEYKFTGDEIAYDLIYNPKMTKFLQRASKAGCRLVYGYEMLLEQGLLQFKTFTGQNYPQ